MVDLGIGRIQDLQGTLPGVRSTERLTGDRSRGQTTPQPAAAGSRDAATEAAGQETAELGPEEIARGVEELNRLLGGNRSLRFRINDETENIRIEIVDTRSGEVIKTLPPSEIREVASRLRGGHLLVDSLS